MIFRDLGALLVDTGATARPPGGWLPSAALALLLVHANRRVSVDQLTDAMWGGTDAEEKRASLESHIWRLRRLIEPTRGRRELPTVLINEQGGYRLVVAVHQVDSLRFELLVEQAGSLLTEHEPERALLRCEEALGLWRGRPFGPLADEAWVAAVVARLDELTERVKELHVDALLSVGQPERALVELEETLAAGPLRTRPWEQTMLAAYRAGRRDQALDTYARARRVFVDSLGSEPPEELRTLQTRILSEDPELASVRAPVTRTSRRSGPAPALPARHNRMIGRTRELARLQELVRTNSVVTLAGPAGCGKTRLAIEVGHEEQSHYDDGVWFTDLTVATTAEQVRDVLISTLALPLPSGGSVEQALVAHTRTRRLLLILDNCEHVLDEAARMIEMLLAGGSEITVLATSREPLNLVGERVQRLAPLPVPESGANPSAIRASPAVELFVERLWAAAPEVMVEESALEQISVICTRVDGVPLAIELAAAQAGSFSLDEIATHVGADASALAYIGRTPGGHHMDVRTAVDWSYRMLSSEEKTLHRRLGVVPGPFTLGLADALARTVGAEPTARDLVLRLVHRSLLVPAGPVEPGMPSRFAQLTTVRGHALHALRDGEGQRSADDLRNTWVQELLHSRPRIGDAAEARWFGALDGDLAALRATLQDLLVLRPSPVGVMAVGRLAFYWAYRGLHIEARRWVAAAMVVESAASPVDRLELYVAASIGQLFQGRIDQARPYLDAGLAKLSEATTPETMPIVVDSLAALAGASWIGADFGTLGRLADELTRLAAQDDDPTTGLYADTVALLGRDIRDPTVAAEEVLADCEAVYRQARSLRNNYAAWLTARKGMRAAAHTPADPDLWTSRTHEETLRLGASHNPALLELRANLLLSAGHPATALQLYSAAKLQTLRSGLLWPGQPETVGNIARARDELGAAASDREWVEGTHLGVTELHRRFVSASR